MLKGINLSLILDLKQLRKLNLCENCDFNKQITFAILSERPCMIELFLDIKSIERSVPTSFTIFVWITKRYLTLTRLIAEYVLLEYSCMCSWKCMFYMKAMKSTYYLKSKVIRYQEGRVLENLKLRSADQCRGKFASRCNGECNVTRCQIQLSIISQISIM